MWIGVGRGKMSFCVWSGCFLRRRKVLFGVGSGGKEYWGRRIFEGVENVN